MRIAANAIRIGQEKSNRARRAAGAAGARVIRRRSRAFFPLSRLPERVAERMPVREAGRGLAGAMLSTRPLPPAFAALRRAPSPASGRGESGHAARAEHHSHPEQLRIARLDLLRLRLDAAGVLLHQLDVAKLA